MHTSLLPPPPSAARRDDDDDDEVATTETTERGREGIGAMKALAADSDDDENKATTETSAGSNNMTSGPEEDRRILFILVTFSLFDKYTEYTRKKRTVPYGVGNVW